MLSICTVLILIILGLFFIKKDTQKELTKFAKDNAMLIGIALLLFLFYGRNMLEGFKGTPIETVDPTQDAEQPAYDDIEAAAEEDDTLKKNVIRSGTRRSNSTNIKPQSSESESELKYSALFKDADINNDGSLTKLEFNKAMGKMNNNEIEDREFNKDMGKMNNNEIEDREFNKDMGKMNNNEIEDREENVTRDPADSTQKYSDNVEAARLRANREADRRRAAEEEARRQQEAQRQEEARQRQRQQEEESFTMFGNTYSMPNFGGGGLFGRNRP